MDKFFKESQHNTESFNKLKEEYNKLRYGDIVNIPCCIFVELYSRLESGSLDNVPKFYTSVLEMISNLEYLKMDNDDAYIIHGIILLPELMNVPEFVKLQDFKEFGFKNGLYLGPNDWLGQQIKNKFDHYSYSWFDDQDSC
jgi:hypothetical protein